MLSVRHGRTDLPTDGRTQWTKETASKRNMKENHKFLEYERKIAVLDNCVTEMLKNDVSHSRVANFIYLYYQTNLVYSVRKAEKKYLVARPLRPFPPPHPSSLVAKFFEFFFRASKKYFFLVPLPHPPLSGWAT